MEGRGRRRNELGACVAERVDTRGCPVAAGPLSCSSKSLNSKTPCLLLHASTIRKVLGLSTTSAAPNPQPRQGQLAL